MKGTRFEFGGVGLFHAEELIESCDLERADAEDLEWAETIFEQDLPIPDALYKDRINAISFFTDKGLETFDEPLDALHTLFVTYCEDAGLGEWVRKEFEIPENMIIYQDEHQFLVRTEDFEKLQQVNGN